MGAFVGYPTLALPQLKNETDASVNLNEYEASIFPTILWITGIVCAPLGGALSGWIGRKKILMITAPVGACGWLIVGLAKNKFMLYIGTFISSCALTSQASSVMPYISGDTKSQIMESSKSLKAQPRMEASKASLKGSLKG